MSIEHVTVPIDFADVTDEDRAIVRNFYEDACHADWCEFDETMLEYLATRSRHNGAAVAFGIMGMAEAIRTTHLRVVEVSGWECFDECSICGAGRYGTEALMPVDGRLICGECAPLSNGLGTEDK